MTLRPLALLALVAGCPGPQPAPPVTPTPGVVPTTPKPPEPDPGVVPVAADALPPKLVVLLVVDQLPQWAFVAKRGALTGGIDRLLREGEWHTGQHPSAATLTAPGHSLLGTGEPPATSGIIANSWWDRDAQAVVEAVRDAKGAVTAGFLRVPGLGDAVAQAGRGKAVAVSLKERAAILPLGHAGTAIWYDPKNVAWQSLAPAPAWLAAYNRSHPIKPRLSEVWKPGDPTKLAKLSGVVDAAPGEVGDKGFGPTFPHDPAATKDPADAIYATPVGNDLVLEMATQALVAEQLGADDAPDLLVVSFSANDYIGHAWGHESWEAWDSLLRLDRGLDGFLAALDTAAGPGRWALIATSDHGASPLPNEQVTYAQIKEAANKAAALELGGGEWIADVRYPTVYLSKAMLAAKDRAKAMKKIIFALRSFPGLGRVERTSDFAGRCERRTGDAFRLCLAIDPQRSGEIFFMPRRGWTLGGEPHATAHGSLHDYDVQVPVIMLAPGRTPHAPLTKPSETMIQMVRISTVLARWLGVTPPTNLPR